MFRLESGVIDFDMIFQVFAGKQAIQENSRQKRRSLAKPKRKPHKQQSLKESNRINPFVILLLSFKHLYSKVYVNLLFRSISAYRGLQFFSKGKITCIT